MKDMLKKCSRIASALYTNPLTFWILGLSALALLTLHTYMRRTDFNFVDEFYNYLSAYFMLQGKHLFTDIFFNHQPLMAWLSKLILMIVKPETLYKYVVLHRFAMIGISLGFMALFIMRLRIVGLLFLVLFEYLRFYIFGFTFQAESIVAYMSAYLFFVVWQLWHNKRVYWFDYVLCTFFFWFTLFSRETLAPLVSFLYVLVLGIQPKKNLRIKIVSLIGLSIASVVMFSVHDFSQWWYQVVEFNKQTVGATEVVSQDGIVLTLLKAFGYPIYVFLGTPFNHYHISLQLLILLCAYALFVYIQKQEQRQSLKHVIMFVIGILIIGGLAALRPHNPGEEFYGAYRISNWVSILCMLTALMIGALPAMTSTAYTKRITAGVVIILLYMYAAPRSYLYDIPSLNGKSFDKYFVSYSVYEKYGNAVRTLASSEDTLHIDGYDALPFITSGVKPAYPVVYFFPPQKGVEVYEKKRTEMFVKNPPTFYLQECNIAAKDHNLTEDMKAQYVPLLENTQSPCLYIYKGKLSSITEQQWEDVKKFGFTGKTDGTL